jgi:hypothetical protein
MKFLLTLIPLAPLLVASTATAFGCVVMEMAKKSQPLTVEVAPGVQAQAQAMVEFFERTAGISNISVSEQPPSCVATLI